MRLQGVDCKRFASHAIFLFRLSHSVSEMLLLCNIYRKQEENLFLDFAKHSFLALHMSMVKLICIFSVVKFTGHNLIFIENCMKTDCKTFLLSSLINDSGVV